MDTDNLAALRTKLPKDVCSVNETNLKEGFSNQQNNPWCVALSKLAAGYCTLCGKLAALGERAVPNHAPRKVAPGPTRCPVN
jgi:hypothetical protein